ncbi:hypothetical protein FGF1_13060 [Flavobacteriaceae bacterium GF1]
MRSDFERMVSITDYKAFIKKYRKEQEITSNPGKRAIIAMVLSKLLGVETYSRTTKNITHKYKSL